MAKATKPKVAETKKEETVKVGALSANPHDSTAQIIDMPKSEAIEKGLIQPVASLDEVVKEVIPEPEKKVEVVLQPEVVEVILKSEPTLIKVVSNEVISDDQKVFNYLEGKSGEVRLNDFLKSLFSLPKSGEPPIWLQQGSGRYLRGLLEKMQADNLIVIKENRHKLLGQPYYPDSSTGKQQHHNLNTVEIIAEK